MHNRAAHEALRGEVSAESRRRAIGRPGRRPLRCMSFAPCNLGLIERGFSKVAITGDSAGGNLALGLLHFAAVQRPSSGVRPVAAVALSPVTDLTLTGASWETRGAADPCFLRSQAVELVRSYLGGHDTADPLASPLYGELAWLPPIRVHVGDNEVLLDDSLRYVERAVAADVDAHVDVWEGMSHGFLSGMGTLAASTEALEEIGAFLADRLTAFTE
jgi:monoterpene epsilon-lactone hydrolase